MSRKGTIVIFPAWGMGHVTPMTELAKHFVATTAFSVAVVILDTPYDSSATLDPLIARVTSSHPSISFHRLPPPSLPPNYLSNGRLPFSFDLLRFSNPQISQFLATLSETSDVRALVLDMFCGSALSVARELHIPTYFFFASSLFVLLSFIQVPIIQSKMTHIGGLKDLGRTPLPLPGVPPIPTCYLPLQALFDRDDDVNRAMCFHFQQYPKSDGILINSFEPLESRVVQAVEDGLYDPIPPVYCIGPLTVERSGDETERHECLNWLDEQPEAGSVVFLCFGSVGSFTADQLREIAVGLERSGQRFLWVVKAPLAESGSKEKMVGMGIRREPDLEELLPGGFLESTKGRGMVVKSWAPQTAVLAHEAVGGFVSHCGWNSTLEAVSAGVAMIAWPLYAEQKMNKVFLVEEARVAVEMEGTDDEEAVVGAEEVERKVRWLMESEEGRAMKERMRALRESAARARARADGGASDRAWKEFVKGVAGKVALQ